jgi:hypothetical protein
VGPFFREDLDGDISLMSLQELLHDGSLQSPLDLGFQEQGLVLLPGPLPLGYGWFPVASVGAHDHHPLINAACGSTRGLTFMSCNTESRHLI